MVKKPAPLRVIFISNLILAFLPFVFYLVITKKGITVGELDPIWMIYTGVVYILTFLGTMASILKKKIWGVRVLAIVVAIASIPAGAYIGMAVAALSFGLTFNGRVKEYFGL